jgi:hypothetical protein
LSENDLHIVEVIVQLNNITISNFGTYNGAIMGGPGGAQRVAFVIAIFPGACPSKARSNTIQAAHLAWNPEGSGQDTVWRLDSAPGVCPRAGSPWQNKGFAP